MFIVFEKLFISAYDYKMAGLKENIPKRWARLTNAGIDLDPAVKIHENVYLGCGQRVLEPNAEIVLAKREMFQRVIHSEKYGKPESKAGGEPLLEHIVPSNDKPKKKKEKQNRIERQGSDFS